MQISINEQKRIKKGKIIVGDSFELIRQAGLGHDSSKAETLSRQQGCSNGGNRD